MANEKTKKKPKDKVSDTIAKMRAKKGPTKSRIFSTEDWYERAYARFSISKSPRTDPLMRLQAPRKF